jgi:hypothetical protein
MEDKDITWFRVIDPLSPLFGCDVKLGFSRMLNFTSIIAMRRIDVFVGDRPFQLIAPENETLGLFIDVNQLEASPFQNETMEMSTSIPYGACIQEYETARTESDESETVLHIVYYDNATQVALKDGSGVLSKNTFFGLPFSISPVLKIRYEFEHNASVESLVNLIDNIEVVS